MLWLVQKTFKKVVHRQCSDKISEVDAQQANAYKQVLNL